MVCGNTFAKTICSICYEDLKPITEDLQSISICGHVFHELCLQQWFEYCSNAKRKNCPVCKQTCSEASVSRLYFQSVGDQTLSQKPISCDEDPGELSREIERLEGKVSGLSSALERCQKEAKELGDELHVSKEQAKKEAASKNEAMQQKASIEQLFHSKSKELVKKTSECLTLQEKNMALAKELATLKLVSDLNLEDKEVLKLASLGNEANYEGMLGNLMKRMNSYKKSYEELMGKCNDLGRGKTDSLRKLEKKEKKIKKLEARIHELEIAVEVKDNEVLRAMKASKKTTPEGGIVNDVKWNSSSSSINKCVDSHLEKPAEQKIQLDPHGSPKLKPSKDVRISNSKDGKTAIANDSAIDSYIIIDDDASEAPSVIGFSQPDLKHQIGEDLAVQKNCLSKLEVASDTKSEVYRQCNNDGVSSLKSGSKHGIPTSSTGVDEDTVLLLDDIKQVQSFINAEKETPCEVPIYQPGDLCFAGGLLGPDGNKRHLGKWCKRVQSKGSTISSAGMQGSNTSGGDLIAVGADGKGGKIKVLRSLNQSSLDNMETSTWAKRRKYGAKPSTLPSQGSLQIEHFFGRAGK